MRRTHFTTFRQHEPGLLGVGTSPSFAIGQRALLVRSGQTNVLWDCIPFIDDASVRIVRALPLHASSVRNIADVLDPWPFDSI